MEKRWRPFNCGERDQNEALRVDDSGSTLMLNEELAVEGGQTTDVMPPST